MKNSLSTNRRWQDHLKYKGPIPFFLDRLKAHALSSRWQFKNSPFNFKIESRERDDELSRAFFEYVEKFPYDIFIEVTNRCNLSCKMCAREHMRRSQGVMDMTLYRKIIDEIASENPFINIHYYHIGEPLTDPFLFQRLAYSRKKGLDNGVVFTNGQLLLKDDNYKKLALAGLNTIGIDVDGFSESTYGLIRRGGSFGVVKRAVAEMYEFVRGEGIPVRIELAYHVYPKVNESDWPRFVNWCNRNNYEYKLVTMHKWTGVNEDIPRTRVAGLSDMHAFKRKTPCCALWNGLTIDWDGAVVVCFQDSDQKEPMGNVRNETIKSIWEGRHRAKRKQFVRGVVKGLCKGCTNFANVALPPFKSALYPESLK